MQPLARSLPYIAVETNIPVGSAGCWYVTLVAATLDEGKKRPRATIHHLGNRLERDSEREHQETITMSASWDAAMGMSGGKLEQACLSSDHCWRRRGVESRLVMTTGTDHRRDSPSTAPRNVESKGRKQRGLLSLSMSGPHPSSPRLHSISLHPSSSPPATSVSATLSLSWSPTSFSLDSLCSRFSSHCDPHPLHPSLSALLHPCPAVDPRQSSICSSNFR
ncbi:hypothetical protein EX30DRAFT_58921 [Ascodesmis nigricans]|uniref:Uncharacterized protein n=1 Tax=Ascodesmis nigricans TaxID=341454 RepID=A0A4S2MUX8_9PEZI|nr:hypothetical protein EX30DRAFT_58921 [Ascodesmis nigricans]